MSEDTKSKIAKLEDELYAKKFTPEAPGDFIPTRTPESAPPEDWDAEDSTNEVKKKKHKKMLRTILIASVAFFVLAASFAGFQWWKGANIISGENIDITISAPVFVDGGEAFEAVITIANKNTSVIQEATLFIEYDQGFYDPTSRTALPRASIRIGQLSPGQVVSETVSALVYGEQNSEKIASVKLEYRMVQSNATLQKTAQFSVRIAQSLVSLAVQTLREVSAGQVIDLTIVIQSNSVERLDNLLLEAVYPLGFAMQSADPSPQFGSNLWDIGSLNPQERKEVTVRGILSGQEGAEVIARASLGAQSSQDTRKLGVIYNTTSETIHITKPFFAVDLLINGVSQPETPVTLDRSVRVDLVWQNNSPSRVTDAVIEVKLTGELLNRYSIFAGGGGFYRSSDDTIVWERSGTPELASIDAGQKGTLSFGFSPHQQDIDSGRILRNPQISLEASARARRSEDTSGGALVTTILTRKINVETTLVLNARGIYYSGPFQNTGGLPPRVDGVTTYTVVWTVRNTSNNVSNVSVRTTLPVYVNWLGNTYPQGERVSYNASGAEVVWSPGAVPAGATREVAFQVAFHPSLSQLNQIVFLTGDTTMTAVDDFTKTPLSGQQPPVRTFLSSDPQFVQTEGAVVE